DGDLPPRPPPHRGPRALAEEVHRPRARGGSAQGVSRIMKFGRIGYGPWGRHHADAIAKAPGARLAAIACRTEATAEVARRDFPDVPVHLHYRQLLARSGVDAVHIALPNDLHADVGVAALERGLDVLLEKPMARTAEECDAL